MPTRTSLRGRSAPVGSASTKDGRWAQAFEGGLSAEGQKEEGQREPEQTKEVGRYKVYLEIKKETLLV